MDSHQNTRCDNPSLVPTSFPAHLRIPQPIEMNQNYPHLSKASGRREVQQHCSVYQGNRFVSIADVNMVPPVGSESERSIPHGHVCKYQTAQHQHPLKSHPIKPRKLIFQTQRNGSSSSSELIRVFSSRIKWHTSRVHESKHKEFEVAERAQVGHEEAHAENLLSTSDQTQAEEAPELAVKNTECLSVPKSFLVYRSNADNCELIAAQIPANTVQQPLPEHDELHLTYGPSHELLGLRNHLETHPSLDTEVPSSGIQSDARSPSSKRPEIPVLSLPTSGFLDEIPFLQASEPRDASPQPPKHSETADICNLKMGRHSEIIFRFGPRRVEAVPFVTRIPIDGPEPAKLTYNNESLILYTWEWSSIPSLDLFEPKSNG